MKRMLVFVLLAALIPANAIGQSLTPIRIAMLGSADGSSEPLYAQSTGIFKKYGLEAEVSSYNGGGAVIAAVAGGSLDAGFSNITTAVQAIQNGIPVMILMPADQAVANGKIVAITTLNGTLQLGAETWIDKNGGDSHSVHFVEIPESSMVAALKQGRVVAAMLGEPLLTPNKADIEVLGNAFAAIAPQWTSSVFVVSKAWATANPDAVRRASSRRLRESTSRRSRR